MASKCPFCGAGKARMTDPFDYICDFECGTIMNGNHGPKRGDSCYEAELTRLREQVEQTAKECGLQKTDNERLRDELEGEKLCYKSLADHVEVHEGELKAEVAHLGELLKGAKNFVLAFIIIAETAKLPDIEYAKQFLTKLTAALEPKEPKP